MKDALSHLASFYPQVLRHRSGKWSEWLREYELQMAGRGTLFVAQNLSYFPNIVV